MVNLLTSSRQRSEALLLAVAVCAPSADQETLLRSITVRPAKDSFCALPMKLAASYRQKEDKAINEQRGFLELESACSV